MIQSVSFTNKNIYSPKSNKRAHITTPQSSGDSFVKRTGPSFGASQATYSKERFDTLQALAYQAEEHHNFVDSTAIHIKNFHLIDNHVKSLIDREKDKKPDFRIQDAKLIERYNLAALNVISSLGMQKIRSQADDEADKLQEQATTYMNRAVWRSEKSFDKNILNPQNYWSQCKKALADDELYLRMEQRDGKWIPLDVALGVKYRDKEASLPFDDDVLPSISERSPEDLLDARRAIKKTIEGDLKKSRLREVPDDFSVDAAVMIDDYVNHSLAVAGTTVKEKVGFLEHPNQEKAFDILNQTREFLTKVDPRGFYWNINDFTGTRKNIIERSELKDTADKAGHFDSFMYLQSPDLSVPQKVKHLEAIKESPFFLGLAVDLIPDEKIKTAAVDLLGRINSPEAKDRLDKISQWHELAAVRDVATRRLKDVR